MMGFLVGYLVVAACVGVRVIAQLMRDAYWIGRQGEWGQALAVSVLLTFGWPVALMVLLDDWLDTHA